jgi:hypothetical protein
MGLFVVAGCFLLPREIGKEDAPVADLHIDLPSVEDIAAHVRDARWRFVGRAKRRTAPPVAATPAPPAMGAPQPMLNEQQATPYILPLTGDNGN